MKLRFAIISTLALLSEFGSQFAYANNETINTRNETAIQFTANSGQQVDAFSGHYFVPENRNNPNSRSIRVNYIRFPATSAHAGSPIVYLAGGPGGSGTGTAKGPRFDLFMALREYGDVIALDQRGTGLSESAPSCTSSVKIEFEQVISQPEIDKRYKTAAQECFAQWQQQEVDIYGYTTVQNAFDIDALRGHLGADKVTLWGISYGSHLALTAMKYMPEHLDKVIIASAEGLNQTVKLPSETDSYFANIQRIIENQPVKAQVPDFVALMQRVHQKLEKQPVKLTVPRRKGEPHALLFQKHHMQTLASMMIADPNEYLAMLIQIYVGIDKGNYQLLQAVLQRGIFSEEQIGFRLMSLAMDVASGITPERLSVVKKQAATSLLGESLNFPMPALANVDSKLDLGNDFRAPLKSEVPTLLFSGTLDGRTYPTEQKEAVKGVSNLTHVTVENAGHNLYTLSPKVLELMKAFLSNLAIKETTIALPEPNLEFSMGGKK